MGDEVEAGFGAGVSGIGSAEEFCCHGLRGLFDGHQLVGGESGGVFDLLEGDDADGVIVGFSGGNGKAEGVVRTRLGEGFLQLSDGLFGTGFATAAGDMGGKQKEKNRAKGVGEH